ncbi:hypothetical protein R3P38DRAFT_2775071 [Favolaschia claudopus]|uniref:Uncharacterized protein n=1 Tax=Favolaschia claudopus TaxID=2862362 RepID=A0AAW0BVM7_9AGAR
MERQRRQELLARKAVQASRKIKPDSMEVDEIPGLRSYRDVNSFSGTDSQTTSYIDQVIISPAESSFSTAPPPFSSSTITAPPPPGFLAPGLPAVCNAQLHKVFVITPAMITNQRRYPGLLLHKFKPPQLPHLSFPAKLLRLNLIQLAIEREHELVPYWPSKTTKQGHEQDPVAKTTGPVLQHNISTGVGSNVPIRYGTRKHLRVCEA